MKVLDLMPDHINKIVSISLQMSSRGLWDI